MSISLGTSTQKPALVHLYPDIQNETDEANYMLDRMIDFSVARTPDLVIFLGDLTNNNQAAEWTVVQYEISRLNAAGIKWLALLGNHDTDSSRNTLANSYLTPGAWISGFYQIGHIENSYALLTLGGIQWLVLGLEFGPRTAVVSWANSVVAANPTATVLLATHCWSYYDNTRYDWAVYGESQLYNPHSPSINYTPAEGTSDGQDLWNNLVSLHPNIPLIVCGHAFDYPDGIGSCYRTDTRLGTICNQVLRDHQQANFGGGVVSELMLDVANNVLWSTTYDTLAKRSLLGSGETFKIPLR